MRDSTEPSISKRLRSMPEGLLKQSTKSHVMFEALILSLFQEGNLSTRESRLSSG